MGQGAIGYQMRRFGWLFAFITPVLLMSLGTTASAEVLADCAPDRIEIYRTKLPEPLSIHVEVADTAEKRAQGLMFRRSLGDKTGMLFIYEYPQPVSFWMRNTLIGLDLIFIDETGVIRHIHPNAKPLDETPLPGNLPADPKPERLMVLEVAAGHAEALQIKTGDLVAYPQVSENLFRIKCK